MTGDVSIASSASSLPCTGGTFTLVGGSLDLGWTGLAHALPLYSGPWVGFRILKRCADDDAACETNGDCGNGRCKATCDCNADTTCEISGLTQPRRCLYTLAECVSNADCSAQEPCAYAFAPPLPVSAGGTPACILSYFDGPLTGTVDTSTGALDVPLNLRARVALGELLDMPCARCGPPAENPRVGEQFTCEGGVNHGAPCTVEAVSPDFGGVSRQCTMRVTGDIFPPEVVIRSSGLTTATTSRTAQLPCKSFAFTSNPLNGTGKCLDNNVACASNADCRRCTGDPTMACADDLQCVGSGTCAEAPDQPISCGYWCHCGFCDNDPGLPCFEDDDCSQGQSCEVGTGNGYALNTPQQKPDDCGSDRFICGIDEPETCAQTLLGRCSLLPFLSCNDDAPCAAASAGTCEFDSRRCFEPRITRTGAPSPLARYCSSTLDPCVTNADCGDGVCLADAAASQAAALLCMPPSGNSAINSALGVTGPAAIRLDALLRICRGAQVCGNLVCGNAVPELNEQCDDGDAAFANGDYCDASCKLVPCGKPTNSAGELPRTKDALFALRAAVGQVSCDLRVCDVDDSNSIGVTDALAILKKAVGRPVTLKCPVG